MYRQAQKILAQVEEAKRQVSDVDENNGGAVSSGILPTLAAFIFPSTLLALSAKYPDAMVIVREQVSEVIVDASARGELDLIIDALPFDSTHFNVEPLFTDEFLVAVQENHPLAKLDEVGIETLEGMPFILLEDVHCLTRQIGQ